MKNEQVIDMIKQLKNEGISFKSMAIDCDIPVKKFYYYKTLKNFPYYERKKLEFVLLDKYKDIIDMRRILNYE